MRLAGKQSVGRGNDFKKKTKQIAEPLAIKSMHKVGLKLLKIV